jgi:hypothetical protein
MSKIAYVTCSDFTALNNGASLFDRAYLAPLIELHKQGQFELKIFHAGLDSISRNFPSSVRFSCRPTLPTPEVTNLLRLMKPPARGFHPRFAFLPFEISERMFSAVDLCGKLDIYEPDIVLSWWDVSSMSHSCKKVYICHEYWPVSLRQHLLSHGVSSTEYLESYESRYKILLSSFDSAVLPISSEAFVLRQAGLEAVVMPGYYPVDSSPIQFVKNKKYVLLALNTPWYRMTSIFNHAQSLVDALDKDNLSHAQKNILYVYSESYPDLRGQSFEHRFNPKCWPSACMSAGIVPNPYVSGSSVKLMTYLASGLPSFVNAFNISDYSCEKGVNVFSVESVLKCLSEDWRSWQDEEIKEAFRSLHGIENTKEVWSGYLNSL